MSEHQNALSRRTFVAGAAMVAAGTGAMVINPLSALADTSADKQAEAQAALASLNELKGKYQEAEAEYGQAVLDQQDAQAKMDEAQTRIDEAQNRISDLQDQLGERARSMYRSGSFSFLDLLLGATTFQAFASNWDLLNNMNKEDADRVSETKDLKAEVVAQKATYEEQERVAREKAESAAEATRNAESLIAEQQAVYDNLSAEAAALVQQEQAAAAAAEEAAAASVVQQSAQHAANNNSGGGGNSGGGNGGNGGGGGNTGGNDGYENYPVDPPDDGSGYVEPEPPSNPSGSAIVSRAYSQLGKPYVWGGVGPDGFDCSGLVSYAISGSYTRLGTTYTFMGWPQVSNPQPGDVAVNSGHCGIYIGGGSMVHAADYGIGVIVGPVQAGMIIVRCPW